MVERLSIGELAKASLKKLSKKTLEKVRMKLITVGKDAAIVFLCNIIVAKTGISRPFCIKAATIIVNKLAREIKEKIKKSRS